ncbi:MAG TPA: DUF1800 domain-containing protein [Thermoanaerobaculia bacterium]|nr:DUF1800 domain-containing protein [Thermoanaerobaculia bacterium]
MKRLAFAAITLLIAAGFSSHSKMTERERAQHALNRLSFGARPGDVDKVLEIGVDRWIAQQLHPESIPDGAVEARLQNMPTLRLSNLEIMDTYYKPIVEARRSVGAAAPGRSAAGEAPAATPEALKAAREKGREVVEDLVSQRIVRAAESERQLNEVMVDFWFNHFNVFIGKGPDRFMLTSYERDTIRPNIWGRFEDLVTATAKSPAMMVYLDNARSRGGAINENYAREIMELHTLGVDGGYTQKDVTELARVFTGWSIDPRTGTFIFRPRMHDSGEKTVLGVHFPAGGGIEEGQKMIHILAHSPAAAHHIALQLCQRLVSDHPPKGLVDGVAKKFLAGDGDLRQTVTAVIESREFWDPSDYRAKVKPPFEFVISAVRAVNATVNNPLPIARALQQIGEPLYGAQPPTGYSDKGDVWINTGALMNRMNFAVALANNQLPGVRASIADPKATALELGSPEFQRQ